MKYPTELQFLEFFGAEPVTQDDVIAYTVSDDRGLVLTLSFNPFDSSLQTSLELGGRAVALVCQEGMTQLWINGGVLMAEFCYENVRVDMKIKTQPSIHVEWTGLRTG